MAFGFPASYEVKHDLVGSRQTARDAVVYAFELVGWDYAMIDPYHFRARVRMTGMSYGEIVIVSLAVPGSLKIISAGRWPLQVFDWGKNKRNVKQFLVYFSAKEIRDCKMGSKEPEYLDEAGNTPVDRMLIDGNRKR
jgi:hypothetical protein